MPLLSIIIVTWNSEEFIPDCLKSIFNTKGSLDIEVIVVDNDSEDGTVKVITEFGPEVKLISNQENLGYAKGNNQGIEIARGEYILLLNPDVVLKENTLKLMLDFMERERGIDGLSPQLLNPDGTIQPSCREFPDFSILLWEITGLSSLFPESRVFGRWRMGYFDFKSVREVDQPMSSFLLLRKNVLEKIGLFDESFPIFFNDVDLCYRIKLKGGKLYFYPEAKAIHHKGASTFQIKPVSILHSHLGFFRFLRKYKKDFLSQLLVYFSGIILMAAALLRIIWYFLKTIFSRNL
ncbi:MAG: glycosyltransferase [candidate division Zixibacteria bacterium]|nr:glycosyltransferase [candidate division Zixibacteria bacterium]